MNYINLSTHKFVGRNNQQLTKKISLDFEVTNIFEVQFINSKNQILDIDSSNLYLAAAIVPEYSNSKLIFYSTSYTYNSETKVLTFVIDSFTENYMKFIKKPNQMAFLEIGKNAREDIFGFDTVVCQPRIYTSNTPSPEHLDEYYTTEEADEKFATISGFNELSGIVSGDIQNLANNYWTKQQVAEQIANIERLTIVVVEELPPVEEGQDFTIYLVPDAEGSADNNYLEYLRINGHWELIGSTAIDLSQYYTKEEVESSFLALSGGIVSGDVTCNDLNVSGNIVANGSLSTSGITVNGSSLNDILSGYIPTSGITNVSTQLYFGQNNHGRDSTYIGEYGISIKGFGGSLISSPEFFNNNGLGTFKSGSSNNILFYSGSLSISYPYYVKRCICVGEDLVFNGNSENIFMHGKGLTTSSADQKAIWGRYNEDVDAFRITGGGTSNSDRKNIEVLDRDGNLTLAGGLSASGAIFTGPVSETGDLYLGGGLSGEVTSLNLKLNYENQLVNILSKGAGYNLILGNSSYNLSLPCVNFAMTTSSIGHVSLNGHQENTPGGFVIQDLSGKITADYLEATSGISVNGVDIDSTYMKLSGGQIPETSSSGLDFILKGNNNLNCVVLSRYGGMSLGHRNEFTGWGEEMIFGTYNKGGQYSVVVGMENDIQFVNSYNVVCGKGLYSRKSGITVYGTWNDTPDANDGQRIYFGCGGSSSDRANAFTIGTDKAITVYQDTTYQKDVNVSGGFTSTGSFIRKKESIDLSQNPAEAEVGNILDFKDKNGTSYFRIIVYHMISGAVRVAFETAAGKGLTVVTDAQGNTHIESPNPDVSSNSNTVATTKFVKDAIAAELAARGL